MENQCRVEFSGTGGKLFGIYITNILLTIITLGIYRFWAQVKVTKYIFQNTRFMGEPFDYHATGQEKFIGFIKGMVLLLAFSTAHSIISAVLMFILPEGVALVISGLIFFVIIIAVFPFIAIASWRFFLARTSYRNLRFGCTGNMDGEFLHLMKGLALTIFTLGIYFPWYIARLNRLLINNSHYGNEYFQAEYDAKELFLIYLKGVLLSIITLGLYTFQFQANLLQFFVNNVSFQNKRLNTELSGLDFFKIFAVQIILILCTFGFGFPWAVAYFYKIFYGSFSMEGPIDTEDILARHDAGANALADGISDTAGVLEGFLDVVG